MEYDLSITDMELENITASWDEVVFCLSDSVSVAGCHFQTVCL